jgi:hypothetical protein
VNVPHQLARQVTNGSKDAAGNHLALDTSEPDLDLIQPGRIGGREVEMHVGVVFQESPNLGGFVCRQVVQDDVDLLFRWTGATTSLRNRTNSSLMCRASVLPWTLPVFTSSAAYRESVP